MFKTYCFVKLVSRATDRQFIQGLRTLSLKNQVSDILQGCYETAERKLIEVNGGRWYEQFDFIDLLIDEECESVYYKIFRRVNPKGFTKIAISCYEEFQRKVEVFNGIKAEIHELIQSNNNCRVGFNIKDLKIADFKPELRNKYKYIIFHLKLADKLIDCINMEAINLKSISDIPDREHKIFSSYIKLNVFVAMLQRFVDAIGYIRHQSSEDFKRYIGISELIY